LTLVLEPGTRKDDTVESRANQPRAGQGGRGGGGRGGRGRQKAPTQYKKRVVGGLRHKSFVQCFTGMVGISLVYRYHDAANLSFEQPADVKIRPGWQNQNLLPNWRPSEGGKKSCEEADRRIVVDQCGITWNKITHLRSAAMEQASLAGLTADEVVAAM
jgi:hypothetical protein